MNKLIRVITNFGMSECGEYWEARRKEAYRKTKEEMGGRCRGGYEGDGCKRMDEKNTGKKSLGFIG